MKGRGKLLALATAAVGVVVLDVAGVAARDSREDVDDAPAKVKAC